MSTTPTTPAGPSHSKPGIGARMHSPWRWLAAVTLVVSGAVHIPVAPEHLQEAPYIGVLFILLTIACFVLAITIIVRDSAAVWVLSAAVTVLAVVGYIVSRSVGLPQMADDVGNWTESLGLVAIIAEALTALVAALVLTRVSTLTAKERQT